MATRQELAKAVRAAYPGEFDDVSDDNDLTNAILQAHPELNEDLDDEAPAKPTIQAADYKKLPLGRKLSGLFDPDFPEVQGLPEPIDPTLDNATFGAIGKLGKFANEGNQALAGLMAEKGGKLGAMAGTALGTASEYLLPQDAKTAGLSVLGGMKAMTMPPAPAGTPQLPAPPPKFEKLKKAGPLAKTSAALTTAETAIPQRYTEAVYANPKILDQTETLADVSKDYTKAFKKTGIQFNSETAAKYSNKNYLPDEGEISRIQQIMDQAEEASKSGNLAPDQAFLARTAASAAKRSDKYYRNPSFKAVVDARQNLLDEFLENNGLPELKGLSQRYFAASAREAFSSLLPQNKNMSPNALRALIMTQMVANGKPLQAAAMSPLLVGEAIKNGAKMFQPQIAEGAARAATQGAIGLDNLFKRKEEKKKK